MPLMKSFIVAINVSIFLRRSNFLNYKCPFRKSVDYCELSEHKLLQHMRTLEKLNLFRIKNNKYFIQAIRVNSKQDHFSTTKTHLEAAEAIPFAPMTISAQNSKANRRACAVPYHRNRHQKTSSISIWTANNQVNIHTYL